MSAEDDRHIDPYLWDPTTPPSQEVEDLERRLAPLRFDATRHPLRLPEARPARIPRVWTAVALAAASIAIAVLGAAAFWSWRGSWTSGAPWPMVIDSTATVLRPNTPVQVSGTSAARIDVAHIGTIRAAPGSSLMLAETSATRHRVVLDRGSVTVRIWAPPARFAFRTPSGSVIDLGCVFDLSVDPDGTSRVRVETGWVQLSNEWGESLVPAGAAALMTAERRPGVAVFGESSTAFASAVRTYETAAEETRDRALTDMLRTARTRDVYTLLILATRAPASRQRPLLTRAAALVPPPPDVTVDAITSGNREMVWRWANHLDLPPVKGWWRNWRDALPWRH